ncbi:MAG TPA: DUF4173 domain-containing protein [Gemmatimonadales bacterium]|nr:DUF4173 domain-containing protein [Gemmatimonadales bacterium]
MADSSKAPLATLAGALLLGITWRAAATLLPGQLDLVAGLALLLAVIAALTRAGVLAIPQPDRLLLGVPAVLLLGALLWRDSEVLVALDAAAVVLLVALAVPGLDGRALSFSGAGEWVARVVRAGAGWLVGAIPATWAAAISIPVASGMRALAAPALGILAISPVLVLFSALLSDADPLFREVLRAMFVWRLGPDVVAIGAGTWFAAGLLWVMSRPLVLPLELPRVRRPPVDSVVSALVAVELLFGLFLVLQARHLFGGRAHLLATEGLTVAEYARRGFFELVGVAALTLPILMAAEWGVDVQRPDERRRMRVHALALLALLGLLLGSALSRMLLYTGVFGLTQPRLYVTVFMGWLAAVLAWFALTSLRGVRHRFMVGAFAAAVQVLLLLNLANPEAIIVRVNVARAAEGKPFDASYVESLGAGALPALLARAERLPAGVRCQVLDAQRARLDRAPAGQSVWNVERARATGPLRDELARAVARACGVRN